MDKYNHKVNIDIIIKPEDFEILTTDSSNSQKEAEA